MEDGQHQKNDHGKQQGGSSWDVSGVTLDLLAITAEPLTITPEALTRHDVSK